MANRISDRVIKSFEKFNADLEAFRIETGDEAADLYEDAFTHFTLKDIKIYKNGKLTYQYDGRQDSDNLFDDDEAKDTLSFWRGCLRRAKKYWSMDTEVLDKIQDGEIEDTTDSEED